MSAVRAAHLNSANQYRPSIFESVCERLLDSLLHTSCKRIFSALSSRSPVFLCKWFNEFYYASQLFVQLNCLRHFGATLTEHFYGLKRVPVNHRDRTVLNRKEIFLSLLCTTFIPYLQEKLKEMSSSLHSTSLPHETKANMTSHKKVLLKISNTANALGVLLSTIQYLRYICGKTNAVTPCLALSGLTLERQVQANDCNNFLVQVLRNGLELSAFFLQFAHWWNTESITTSKALPVPPPPKVGLDNELTNFCVLCNGKRSVETSLATSGYSFCTECIMKYVDEFKKCPITKIPSKLSDLIYLHSQN